MLVHQRVALGTLETTPLGALAPDGERKSPDCRTGGRDVFIGHDLKLCHLVMTNIAMENPNRQWRFLSLGKSSKFRLGPSIPWLC